MCIRDRSEIIDPVSEAASAPVKPKKAAVDDDSDADKDAAETASPAKKETFAERRARLAAEKAASEAAAEGEGAAAVSYTHLIAINYESPRMPA